MFTEKKYGKGNKRKEKSFFCLCTEIFFLLSAVLFLVPRELSAGTAGKNDVYPAPVKKLSNAQKHALSLRAKFRPELKKQLDA